MPIYQAPGQRPPLATFFGWTSLVWALFMLGWVLVVVALAALIGAGSWLGGPIAGVVGTAIGGVIALYCILSSLLSFLLLYAGWLILRGDPRGVALLRTWAWVSLIYDVLILLFSGGFAATSWAAVTYALAILYFTRPPEGEPRRPAPGSSGPHPGKPNYAGDRDF